jgi:sugar-specific transcriptional regulator TrmB
MNIEQNLEYLGLKTKEIKAYLAILKLQKANPHQIAKEAGLERTTVYKLLDSLTERGLVSKSALGKRVTYTAESPKQLKQVLSKQESVVDQLLPFLSALQGSRGTKPVIKFYEHQDGIRQVLSDSLNCQEKVRRDFAFVETVVELFGLRFLHKHIEDRVKKKIIVKSLRRMPSGSKISEKDWYLKKDNKSILREVRYLPKSIKLRSRRSHYFFEKGIFCCGNRKSRI